MTTVGITGHQRLPDAALAHLREQLPDVLRLLHARTVVSSLAEGADQECAEIATDLGLTVKVIIPSEGYIGTFEGEARDSYSRLLTIADSVTTLPFAEPSEGAFLEAGKQVADQSDVLVAVWDGQPAAGKGGTADVVQYARAQHKRVELIWPEGVRR